MQKNSGILILTLALLLNLLPEAALAKAKKAKKLESFQVEIVGCHDGDTCRGFMLPKAKGPNAGDSEKVKIRFSGIDAPEAKQKFGGEARDYLQSRILGKQVRIDCEGKSWERRTCHVFLGDENINETMVKEGWAWDSPKYSKGAFKEAQNTAQIAKKGIWKEGTDKNPAESPYCFRHKKNKNCRVSAAFNP